MSSWNDSGIRNDRTVDVGLIVGQAEFTLGHAWGDGAAAAGELARECLHVGHYGFREDVDPSKVAAFAAHPFKGRPLTLAEWPTRAHVIAGACHRLWESASEHRAQGRVEATLCAMLDKPLMSVDEAEWGGSPYDWRVVAETCIEWCTGFRPMVSEILALPEFPSRWRDAVAEVRAVKMPTVALGYNCFDRGSPR